MLRVPHGTDTLLIQISMCTISNLVSSVRVQVEVMALLMSLQRAMAVVLSNLRLKDESQNSMVRKLYTEWVAPQEDRGTGLINVLLVVNQPRQSTRTSARSTCSKMLHACTVPGTVVYISMLRLCHCGVPTRPRSKFACRTL